MPPKLNSLCHPNTYQLWDAETIILKILLYLMQWENKTDWALKFAIKPLAKNLGNHFYLLLSQPVSTVLCSSPCLCQIISQIETWFLAICVNIIFDTIFMILWILYVLVALSLKQLHATFCAVTTSLPLV